MKDFRLFKRADSGKELPATAAKDKPYYFRFVYRGKVYSRCLETNLKDEAQTRARARYAEITSAVQSGQYKRVDATKLRQEQTAEIAKLTAAYRTGPAEAGSKTRATNLNAFQSIAKDCTYVRELTPGVIRAWFESVTTKVLAEPDQQQAASLKRSANSCWAKARSLFTTKCLAHYQDQELIETTDTLDAFVRAGNNAIFSRIPKVFYNPPSEDIIRKTVDAWEAITDRDLFLAIGHELTFGLRISEMAQAKWGWHTTRSGYPVLDGRATVKNGSGIVQVRALDPWYSLMAKRIEAEKTWRTKDEDLIITGTKAYCTDAIFRSVSDWLRGLGWETRKTNHALRAYAGSQVAMKYGIYEAQMWLRHSTVKVTEQNYSHFVAKFKPQDLDKIPTRWAMLPVVETAKVTSTKIDVTLDATPDLRQTPPDSAPVIPWLAPSRN